jgi:ADP-ribosylglycohydrolase
VPDIAYRRVDLDHFRGCLLGGALGDALGYPIEFKSLASIRAEHADAPPLELTPGIVSDDTQMTLFTAEGVIRHVQRGREKGISSLTDVMRPAYQRWYFTQKGKWLLSVDRGEADGHMLRDRRLFVERAPGNTCLSALSARGKCPTVDRPPNDSKGCGAVMRAAPLGLAAGSREEAFAWGRDTGVITHGHPSGYLASAYLAALIFDLARGLDLSRALDDADRLVTGERRHEELLAAVQQARLVARTGAPTAEQIERLGGGWVGEEALAIGVLCALTADTSSPEGITAALWRAAAHSGDSDSTGSITGNLLGAIVGVAGLPARWVQAVEMRELIERVADDLFAACVEGRELPWDDYPGV